MTERDQSADTRQRLLEAAGQVFAERGFHHATIREICERAKAKNVAAVHYHFGEKEELYRAVFEYASKYAPRLDEEAFTAGSAEQRLRRIVHTSLSRFFDEGRPAWLGKLIAREMIEPTSMLDMMVKQQMRPNAERLKEIIRELIDDKVDDETLRHCMLSVAAQWVFYFHNGPVIKRLYPAQRFGPKEVDRLVDDITRFSVAALKGWKGTRVEA